MGLGTVGGIAMSIGASSTPANNYHISRDGLGNRACGRHSNNACRCQQASCLRQHDLQTYLTNVKIKWTKDDFELLARDGMSLFVLPPYLPADIKQNEEVYLFFAARMDLNPGLEQEGSSTLHTRR